MRDRRIGNLAREDVVAVYGDEFFAAPTIPTLPTPVVAPIPQSSIQKTKDLFEPFAPLRIVATPEI